MPANVFQRRVKEKAGEGATNKWYDARFPDMRTKMNFQGHNGWPDQCYWIPGGRPFLIEFKAEGEDPRPLQAHIHGNLVKAGYDVETHHDSESAIAAIRRRLFDAERRAQEAPDVARAVAQASIRRAGAALEKFGNSIDALAKAAEAVRAGRSAGPKAKAPQVDAEAPPGEGGEVRRRPRGRRVLP